MRSIVLSAFFVLASAMSAHATAFKIDEKHSSVGFSIKHLMISNVKGSFNKFSGTFDYDAAKKQVKDVEVTIDTNSISTNEPDRDAHLRNADFFDVQKYPKITFKSTKVEFDGKKGKATGPLTIKDKTKTVTFDFTYGGEAEMMGTKKVAFSAGTTINRKDFGLNWNKNLDKGGVAVGDDVIITIEGEADAAAPAKK